MPVKFRRASAPHGASFWASSFLFHHLLILLAAALLTLPCLRAGIPDGYDAPTHVSYQHHFDEQFWKGDYYPRWLMRANKGYGAPTFFIQYPFPYFIPALLRLVLAFPTSPFRESRELGVYCFLVIAAAATAARFWFSRRFSPVASTLAAVVYIFLPYVISCLYTRAAVGELTTFVWMPLMFAMCDVLGARAVSALGLFGSLLILCNLLIACLCLPAIALYALAAVDDTRTSAARRCFFLLAGFALSAAMSAAYLLPFLVYRRYFDFRQMSAYLSGFELGRYFVSLRAGDWTEHKLAPLVLMLALGFALAAVRCVFQTVRNKTVGLLMCAVLILGGLSAIPDLGSRIVGASGLAVSGFELPAGFAVGMMVTSLLTISLGYLSYCQMSKAEKDHRSDALLLIASGSFFFMLPWSAPIWKAIPALGAIQFPFRTGAILSVAVAGLLAGAFDGLRNVNNRTQTFGILVTAAVLASCGGGLMAWRIDWKFRHPAAVALDRTTYVDINYRMYVSAEKIAAFSRLLGTSASSYEVGPTRPLDEVSATFITGKGQVEIHRAGFRQFIISIDCGRDGLLEISQLYFPLWKLTAAGPPNQSLNVQSSEHGLVQVPIGAGKQTLRLALELGWPERYGLLLSGISLVVGMSLFCLPRSSLLGKVAELLSRSGKSHE